eukprot:TRINITY_DN56540_c0_g1_i1.p1 TRINITY_DN56540_c0_g1~~TRINITY_DN56540_c0_g1_i1.p1  ORF type:complete len:817 (+),score=11.06 TRINITY_DN56540_c0_g1_i1:27-2477(+)
MYKWAPDAAVHQTQDGNLFQLCIEADTPERYGKRRRKAKGQRAGGDAYIDKYILTLQALIDNIESAAGEVKAVYSVDGKQVYYLIYFPLHVLLCYAEADAHVLSTNPDVGMCGVQVQYTRRQHHLFEITEPRLQMLAVDLLRAPKDVGGCALRLEHLVSHHVIRSFFPLHTFNEERWAVMNRWASLKSLFRRQPITEIRMYFGDKIALYFAWLEAYTIALIGPALIGVGVAVFILIRTLWIPMNSHLDVCTAVRAYDPWDSVVVLFWGVTIALWSIGFNIFWWRKQSQLCAQWGSSQSSDRVDTIRSEFRGTTRQVDLESLRFSLPLRVHEDYRGAYTEIYSPSWIGAAKTALIVFPIIVLYLCVASAFAWFLTTWRFRNVNNEVVKWLSSACTVVSMLVMSEGARYFCPWLTSLENPRTEIRFELSLVTKLFLIDSVTTFAPTAFIAVVEGGLNNIEIAHKERHEQLVIQLLMALTLRPVFTNVAEILWPIFLNRVKYQADIWKNKNLKHMMSNLDRQANLAIYTAYEEHLEITIQYGLMCMFSLVAPWGPLACCFWNLVELRLDALKLLRCCRRPFATPVANMKTWNWYLLVLTYASILTGSYIVCFMTNALQALGLSCKNTESEFLTRVIAFVSIQYTFFFLYIAIAKLVPTTPHDVIRIRQVQEFYLKSKYHFNKQLQRYEERLYQNGIFPFPSPLDPNASLYGPYGLYLHNEYPNDSNHHHSDYDDHLHSLPQLPRRHIHGMAGYDGAHFSSHHSTDGYVHQFDSLGWRSQPYSVSTLSDKFSLTHSDDATTSSALSATHSSTDEISDVYM